MTNELQESERGRQEAQDILDSYVQMRASSPYLTIPDILPKPPEWEKRAKPADSFPHILPLAAAIQECGCALFPDLWQERDWYSRQKDQQDRWNDRENNAYGLRLAAVKDTKGGRKFGADFSNDPEQEQLAYDRKLEVYKNLISWLNAEQIDCFTLDKDGNRVDVPVGIWLTDRAHSLFDSGRISGDIIAPDRVYETDLEAVWLDRAQFNKHRKNATTPRSNKRAAPISEAALVAAYNNHVNEHEKNVTIPTWKQDQEAMEQALGKKPTDSRIKQIRRTHAPEHWKQQGRRKTK
ncbi:MAG TPA: hypothetical protein PLE43_02945 [Alphaproteobacteria bacterium]|nr:hypothetical protein [Alphaproteobacteria bacterium]